MLAGFGPIHRMTDLLAILADLVAKGIPCATATIVAAKGSIPNAVGAKMLVGQDGALLAGTIGGGQIEFQILADARDAIAQGQSKLITAKLTEREAGGIGMMCGGSAQVFVDVFRPAAPLIFCGAGHISKAAVRIAEGLGFALTVIDDRAEWANRENYPAEKIALIVERPETALRRLCIGHETFIVIATRDGDLDALHAASDSPARYIGLVASKRKAIQITKSLAARGVDLAGVLPRLRSPVGLALGGHSPEAVALSIIAEIQAHRHGETGRPMTVDAEKMRGYADPDAQP